MSKIVYEKVGVELRSEDGKGGPMSAEDAKELLGWQEEAQEQDFKDNFVFRDLTSKKIKLANVPTNRPFRMGLAKRYANEIVRKKWRLNGETIIIDRQGHIQGGQHRLVGLVLAEQMRQKEASYYREHFGWRTAIAAEMLIVKGISERADTVDTIDLGQKRSLGDVMYRRREFKSAERRNQQRLANMLANATRLVWLRAGGKTVSDAKHFPHSEALEFMEAHPRLNEACEFVLAEEGGEKRISTFISLGYAAGLMYLMGAAQTDPIKFMEKGTEALNFKGWDQAEKFWTILAAGENLSKGDPILLCRNALAQMSAGGAQDRDEKCGVVINAFNLWVEGKKGESIKDIKVKRGKDPDSGKIILIETPRLGGIDVEREPEEPEEVVEEEAKVNLKPKGQSKKGRGRKDRDWTGEWAWIADDHPWKGQVKSVAGKTATVTAEEDGADYNVPVTSLMDDKPE